MGDTRPAGSAGPHTGVLKRYARRGIALGGMSSPVSSRSGQDGLEGAVLGGVVGDVVLPAAPDDVEPGAGEDADGVGVVVSSGSGSGVEVGGPGVGVVGVAGEVDDRAAQLLVDGPAERDHLRFAGLAGRGGGAGQAGQGFWGGIAAAGVTVAVGAAGGHPVVPGHDSRSLTDRRSIARSPVASPRVLGHRTPQNSCRTSKVKRARRWPGGDQGYTGNHPGTGPRSLPNQSPADQRLDQ